MVNSGGSLIGYFIFYSNEQKTMRIILWAPSGAGTHYWGPGTSAYRLYRLNKNLDIKVTLVHGTDRQGDFPGVYDEQVQSGNLEGAGKF